MVCDRSKETPPVRTVPGKIVWKLSQNIDRYLRNRLFTEENGVGFLNELKHAACSPGYFYDTGVRHPVETHKFKCEGLINSDGSLPRAVREYMKRLELPSNLFEVHYCLPINKKLEYLNSLRTNSLTLEAKFWGIFYTEFHAYLGKVLTVVCDPTSELSTVNAQISGFTTWVDAMNNAENLSRDMHRNDSRVASLIDTHVREMMALPPSSKGKRHLLAKLILKLSEIPERLKGINQKKLLDFLQRQANLLLAPPQPVAAVTNVGSMFQVKGTLQISATQITVAKGDELPPYKLFGTRHYFSLLDSANTIPTTTAAKECSACTS